MGKKNSQSTLYNHNSDAIAISGFLMISSTASTFHAVVVSEGSGVMREGALAERPAHLYHLLQGLCKLRIR
jgi:hypothetical protein